MTKEKPSYLGHRKRVKTKFLNSMGVELHEYELLEILLFSVFPRSDTKPIAKRLLAKFGDLSSLINAEKEQLQEVEGVGESLIVTLKVNAEIINRVLKKRASQKEVLSNWKSVLDYAKNKLSHLNYEVFRVIFLDKNHQIIEDELLSKGQEDFVHVSAKEIAKKALLLRSSSLILLHNHPSASAKPSNSDIKTTNNTVKALKPLDIEVLDHIIIGKAEYFSFKEQSLI